MSKLVVFVSALFLGLALSTAVNLYLIQKAIPQDSVPVVIGKVYPIPVPLTIPISTTDSYTAFKLYEGFIVVMAPFKETDVAEDIAVLESLVDPTLPVTCFLMINVGVKYESETGTWYAPYDHPCLLPKKDLKKKSS